MTARASSPAVPGARYITISEWQTAYEDGIALSEGDRGLCEQLRTRAQIVIEEMRSGVRVETKGWVGVVQLEQLEIRVSPKLAGDAIGVARLLAFTRGLAGLERRNGANWITHDTSSTLLELLAQLLAEEVERVVRLGVHSDYVAHEEELAAIRGRFLPDRQALLRMGRLDRVWCRFDELESDVDDNRLLALALHVAARRVRHEKLHRRLRYLTALFDEICDSSKYVYAESDPPIYDRQNEHYRDAHSLAALILQGAGVDDAFAARGNLRSFAFLLDMNSLFEEFVWRLIYRLFAPPDFRVESQEKNWSVLLNATTNRPYRSIRPDVVVHRSAPYSASVAVDAKYKRYDLVDASSADLYQGLLYAQAYRNEQSAQFPTAMLVYPASQEIVDVDRVHLRRPNTSVAAELSIIGLPVRRTLETIDAPSSPAAFLRSQILKSLGV